MAAATIPRIGDVGARLDLDIRQGGTFGPYEVQELDDATGLPVDISGCTFVGQIRKTPTSATVVATFTCVVTDGLLGLWTYGMADEVTAAITAGNASGMAESRYTYDIEMHDVAGNVYPRLYGGVFVWAENTRP